MCGIIGYVGESDPKEILLEGLKRLEYRGYDSAGIAILEAGKSDVCRSVGKLDSLIEKLKGRNFAGRVGIGHTRWATHGSPSEENAHPHQVGHVTLVHNGIIENYEEHRASILALGRELRSETDSEIIAHLVDIEIESGHTLEEAVMNILPKLRGSYAFVVLNSNNLNEIVGVRNGAPLIVGMGEGEKFLTSDVQAILDHTKRVIYLKDGQFAVCRREGVVLRSLSGDLIDPVVTTVSWNADQLDKQGYKHYMLKEIYEQPQAIANTIEGNIDHTNGKIQLKELQFTEQELRDLSRISIVACGTARHAGMVGKFYFERFAGISVDVDYASEFRYCDPVLDSKTLCLLISQSGETADTLAALREAKQRGIKTLAICNVRESTIAREADSVIYTNAGPEIGVASTKAFTTQLVVLYMLAVQLGTAKKYLSDEQARELTQDLVRLPHLVESTLPVEDEIKKIITELQGYRFYFFLGRGIHYPLALEGALKLKEISYLHAEGYPGGELKHGPIALVDKEHVTVVLAAIDQPYRTLQFPTIHGHESQKKQTLYEKILSNLQSVKARGGRIISIGTELDPSLKAQSWLSFNIPKATWALNPILASIPLQFFAYHVALQRGTDVDKPRNLAKSVTVE